MEIKILGPGCPKCKTLEKMTRDVVAKHGIDANITKVEDIEQIMSFGIMATPAIVIDGAVVLKGRLPSESELTSILSK